MAKIPRSVGTHDGTFHADEVTACALLILFGLVDQDKVFRTRDSGALANCEYVCDVGGFYDPSKKLFDHHQVEYKGPLSSAGMILRYLNETKKISDATYDFLNRSLIWGVDAHDNGIDPAPSGYCSFSHIINNYNPIHYGASRDEQNALFHSALDFVLNHLRRLNERFDYIQSCKESVLAEMNKKERVLFFEKGVPWLEIFFENDGENHPAEFVIMPSGGHWKLRAIPPSYQQRMKVRRPLPEEWAGLHDDDLFAVSKIKGSIFCHKGRFISVWETKEAALEALAYILKGPHDNPL